MGISDRVPLIRFEILWKVLLVGYVGDEHTKLSVRLFGRDEKGGVLYISPHVFL